MVLSRLKEEANLKEGEQIERGESSAAINRLVSFARNTPRRVFFFVVVDVLE
jgi:hypothetical protein